MLPHNRAPAKPQGLNIFSGEKGLGGALTNPTELARRKGSIDRSYPIVFSGRKWVDVETAYHALQAHDICEDDALMAELIAAKFHEHPHLLQDIRERGGRDFLLACTHLTGAKSASSQSWEGAGRSSRFIRNLLTAFERAELGLRTEGNQQSLF